MSIEQEFDKHFQRLSGIYDRALEAHGFDRLFVFSGEIKKRFQDDLPYPYYAGVQFRAIAPIDDAPGSWIVWRVGMKPLLLLFQPQDIWHVVPSLPDEYWCAKFEIQVITEPEQVKPYLGDGARCAFLGEHTKAMANWPLGQRNPGALIAELNWHRSFKSHYEQSCIRHANTISAKGHVAARDAFFSGASEFEISLAFQAACTQPEERLAYPSIVAINEHAAVLHYLGRSQDKEPGHTRRSFLLDAGAACQGYASDITRTYCYDKSLFGEMLEELDSVQQNLVDLHQVGLRYSDINALSQRRVAELILSFKLVNMTSDSLLETGLIKAFCPHPLGHFIGLQVHDVGANQANSAGDTLAPLPHDPKLALIRSIEPNQLVTVEPGIYFNPLLLNPLRESRYGQQVNWSLVEALMPYGGMRIEDNVLIGEAGPENFTRQAFSGISP